MKKSLEKTLAKMGVEELTEAQKRIDKLLKDKRSEHKKKLRQQFEQMAGKSGFSLNEVLAAGNSSGRRASRARKSGRGKRPRPPKYRHPNNSDITWSGFGKRPYWIKEHLAAGKSLQDLLIK